ncbi:MAG: hypothetical protein K6C14_04885 [Eubacterium sp.]|nr:hypothetical protein [Eubacterium sp.]
MNFFDSLIERTDGLLSSFEKKDYPLCEAWNDLGKNTVVLKRDEAYELDGIGFNLVTSKDIGESGITVIGRDLGDIDGNTKFARISLIKMKPYEDEQSAYGVIRKVEYLKYHYYPEGFMVRTVSTSHKENVRVTRDALKNGITFQKVGSLLVSRYLENPSVLSARVIYVTEPAADYNALAEIADKNYAVTEALNHIMENLPLDCSACNLKPVCDEVEGMRELHFKNSGM